MGINYSILNHNLLYKETLNNQPFLNCVFTYVDNMIEFIDEEKIIVYKKADNGGFIVYIGIIENLLDNNYSNISKDNLYKLGNEFADFTSMKEYLLDFDNKKINAFLCQYEKDHIVINSNYLNSLA